MVYKLVYTARFRKNYWACLDYLEKVLENYQAMIAVAKDVEETLAELAKSADFYSILENKKLNKRGIRRIRLKHHRYKIFFRIEGDTVYVVNILHNLQDYKNVLK